jgi:hypothetical protein
MGVDSVVARRSRACWLLDPGKRDIAIRDGQNNSLSGDDLVACCRATGGVTADLEAVPS